MTYNSMYETLVDQGESSIEGYVAYCLYKHSKREWIRQFEAEQQRTPSADELRTYVSSYTPQLIAAVRTQAAGILVEFADGAIDNARAGIVEDALKGSTYTAIRDSIIANAIYTVVLVVIVIILKYAGVDILGLANSAG